MSHLEGFSRSAIKDDTSHHRVNEWPNKLLAPEPRIYCAYNQTRRQFLSAHVELADLSPENLSEYIAPLAPGSAKSLWLAPFRGISADRVNTPIDLVFLDRNNFVLAVVESFSITQPTSCNWPAGTALALPARSVASSGTLAGDHLVLCSPQKMKRRLLNLSGMPTSDYESEDLPSNPYSIAHYLPPTRKEPVQLASWEEVFRKTDTTQEHDALPPAIATPVQESTLQPMPTAPAPERDTVPEELVVLPALSPTPEEAEVCAEIPAVGPCLFFKRRPYRARFRAKFQYGWHVRRYL